MTSHLARHAGITNDPDQDPTLILFDGHKSHVRLTLTNVVRQRNVTLFLLPPHITQPLDVSIFGPFKNMYYRECSSYMQQNPGATVTKYEIAKLSSKPYLKAISPDNLVSSFRKTGIFPLKPEIFDTMPESTAPATIYAHDKTQPTECAEQTGGVVAQLITDDKQNKENIGPSDFFKNKTIRKESVKKIKRKFVPPFLAGNLLKESNIQILESYEIKKQKLEKETKCEKKQKVEAKHRVNQKENRPQQSVQVRNQEHLVHNQKHLALYPSILAVQMTILLMMRRCVAFATNGNQKNFPIWQESAL